MNENEVNNNINENNVVTLDSPVVSEEPVVVSTPEVIPAAPVVSEPVVTTPVVDVPVMPTAVEAPVSDVTAVVETPVVEQTPVVETAPVAEAAVAESTPVVETTPVPEVAPVAETPVTPVVDAAPAAAVVSETSEGPTVIIEEAPEGEHYVAPQVNASAVAETVVTEEATKKKSNTGLIIIIVVLVAVLLVVAGYVLFTGKENKPSTGGNENNNGEVNKPSETPGEEVKPEEKPSENAGTLAEDVRISGYMCMGTVCTISVRLKDAENSVDYKYSGQNVELIKSLSDYSKYIKVNIYVTGEGENITIVNYELFNKSTNEKINDVTTEAELRTVLGMYNIGTHTAELTLVEIGMVGAGFGDNEESYTYRDYDFTDEKGFEYEMRYINPGTDLDALVEGNKYTVTFDVSEGSFDYEYIIKEIK